MLARSGKVTVKVTGNSSTAHVASFIADPSTIAATNSDLSTLKATVEDGSGNLIEGLTEPPRESWRLNSLRKR